jgi:ATP-dependent RNA helicase DDX10/DBP4
VFNDDGEAQDLSAVIDPTKNPNIENDNKKLEEATESYLGQVRARLESSRAQDLADEKERIRQKHKKRKLKEKEERRNDSDDGPLQVTLGSGAGDEQESVHTNSSDDMSSSDDDSSQSSTASQRSLSLDDTDIKKQEEMALALIRGQS